MRGSINRGIFNKEKTKFSHNMFKKPAFSLKPFFILTIFFFFTIFSSPITSADVISLNPGGTGNLIVNPDKYIEGFFFGLEAPVGPVCGNSVIESGETCDDGNVVNGDGCSSTCQTEVVTPPPTDGGGVTPTYNLAVNPTEFNINLAINTNVQRIIQVTNLGTSSVTVSVTRSGLDNMVILDKTSMTLAAGQTQNLNVIFVALDEPGIYTGTINIGNRRVSVSLNVKTKLLLFDSNIVVLNKNYEVPQGNNLRTLVTLIPLGDPDRLDVTLNFVIKDYQNKIYLTKSETLLVEKQIELKRNFDTGILPLGQYIIGLELIYPDGVAPSSAHFIVTEKKFPDLFGRIVLFLLLLILLILILIVIILIIRRLRKMQKEKALIPGS